MSDRLKECYAEFQSEIHNPRPGTFQETLVSNRDKDIIVRRARDGEPYVLRRYTAEGIQAIAGNQRRFERNLAYMEKDFGNAGIQLVEHELITDTGSDYFPLVIVTDYVEDIVPLSEAQKTTKRKAARALGSLAVDPGGQNDIFITGQMIRPDMFHVEHRDGPETLVLLDMDPYVEDTGYKPEIFREAMILAAIQKSADVLWNHWVKPDERYAVIGELAATVSRTVRGDEPGFSERFDIALDLNALKQGVSTGLIALSV